MPVLKEAAPLLARHIIEPASEHLEGSGRRVPDIFTCPLPISKTRHNPLMTAFQSHPFIPSSAQTP